MTNQLLRQIPKVDDLLNNLSLQFSCDSHNKIVLGCVRRILQDLRNSVLDGTLTEIPSIEALLAQTNALIKSKQLFSLREVINGTGIILHTNLGRACLSRRAAQAVANVACSYSTLEYDITTGKRGLRYAHVEELLQDLTGAESALVVNNNAAAVLLVLSTMAKGGEVIISRGELVEIGGAFRVPEIMESCGAFLKEIGTTNKTHLRDYVRAINENTRALMKVHTSNYKIVGFTEAVSIDCLANLGREKGIPVIEDLGSGYLYNIERLGIHDEPTVRDSIRAGVDVVTFSGDKLLGGPQAGIILGKKKYVDRFRQNPLTRAMRIDKMTLAALMSTLRSYAEGKELQDIPTLSMLKVSTDTLHARANFLCDLLTSEGIDAKIVPEQDQVGGGSVPTQLLEGFAIAVFPSHGSVIELESSLRQLEKPIIGRIAHDQYLLSVRTLFTDDFPYIVQAFVETAL